MRPLIDIQAFIVDPAYPPHDAIGAQAHHPASPNTVQVSIIDTATTIRCPADIFLAPRVDGLERLTANAFSFLIENPRAGRKVVFDLGVRRDWENYAQPLSDHLKRGRFDIEVKKNVAEILTENGVKLEDIESIIWR